MGDARGRREALDLEARLRTLGAELAWPRGDRVAAAVAARVAATPVPRARLALPASRRRRRALAVLAAAALLAAFAAAAHVSIGAIGIREAPRGASPVPSRAPASLGRPATLAEAGRALGEAPVLPTGLGAPDAISLGRAAGEPIVAMAWEPRAGLPRIEGIAWGAVVLELGGDSPVATKTLFPSAPGGVEGVDVDGEEGYWLTGRHELDVATAAAPRRFLVTGNVLLWTRGDLTLRLETGLSKSAAIDMAEAMAPASAG